MTYALAVDDVLAGLLEGAVVGGTVTGARHCEIGLVLRVKDGED